MMPIPIDYSIVPTIILAVALYEILKEILRCGLLALAYIVIFILLELKKCLKH